MRILFLIQGFDTAASRYRVLQFLPLLEREGVVTVVKTHPRGLSSIASALSFGGYDAVFIQRKRLRGPARLIAGRTAKRIVFDFDDSIMYRNSLAESPDSRLRASSFRKMAGMCDSIIVGNSFLRDQTVPFTDARVTIVPTVVDVEKYGLRDHYSAPGGAATLGWIGAHGSIHYLERLKTALDRMHERNQGLKLRIVCDTFMKCGRMPVEERRWSMESELDELRSFDIGLMPLLDDPWSRGKCGFKIVQCLGAGVPVVCTPVGVNRDIVTHGVEGFWASNDDEWVDGVLKLAADPGLRAAMGQAGRKKVMERYSVKSAYPLFKDAVLCT